LTDIPIAAAQFGHCAIAIPDANPALRPSIARVLHKIGAGSPFRA
jgi:hypothetical protein